MNLIYYLSWAFVHIYVWPGKKHCEKSSTFWAFVSLSKDEWLYWGCYSHECHTFCSFVPRVSFAFMGALPPPGPPTRIPQQWIKRPGAWVGPQGLSDCTSIRHHLVKGSHRSLFLVHFFWEPQGGKKRDVVTLILTKSFFKSHFSWQD